MNRVIVIGLDGLEPSLVDTMIARGDLPHLAALGAGGGYGRVQTTFPAQTPVAWSTFATGTNPGGHGIFDFIRRDPLTYLPDFGLTRYERRRIFLPPTAVNLRRGTPMWQVLSQAGIPSTILRCPCTYPPDDIRGRLLSGLGVPDLRGGLGTGTFYTTAIAVQAGEGERIEPVTLADDVVTTAIIGPRRSAHEDSRAQIRIDVERGARRVLIRSDGQPSVLEAREGRWSPFVHVRFKVGSGQHVSGVTRFFLVRIDPVFELYASPVNFDPANPMFPVSTPPGYARDLASAVGTFHTAGMAEDHRGLSNERYDEEAFLEHCTDVLHERERMMAYELERFERGLFFCLFDTPDRIQHMFWRFGSATHPANRSRDDTHLDADRMRHVIPDHYRRCDQIVGRAMEHVDDSTLLVVLSDHGMTSFERGVHLNSWLRAAGLLAVKQGHDPDGADGSFFHGVDWGRTKAYSLGLGGIYLNLKGRERDGTVGADEAEHVKSTIAEGLSGLVDPERGDVAVRRVLMRDQVYRGACLAAAPDVVVGFNHGYRASWATTLGGVPDGLFEDNTKKWSGDHIVDPDLVPGVLFMNRPFDTTRAALVDLAPTILGTMGVPAAAQMEGRSLL